LLNKTLIDETLERRGTKAKSSTFCDNVFVSNLVLLPKNSSDAPGKCLAGAESKCTYWWWAFIYSYCYQKIMLILFCLKIFNLAWLLFQKSISY